MTNHFTKSPVIPIIKGLIWMLCLCAAGYVTYAEWHGLGQMRLLRYDYAFFYYAFEVVLHHQPAWHLYNISAEQTFLARLHFPFLPHNQYVYPPQFAVLFSFLGALPFSISATVWMLMSTVLYGLGVFWIARMLWPNLGTRHVLIILGVAGIMTPFQIDIGVGNVNSLLFAAVTLTFYLLYHRRRAWWAGIPLGLAIVFKVTPVAILIYFLLRRQWRVSISALLTTSLISGFTAVLLGGSSLVHYVGAFISFGQTSMKNGPAPYNQSLLGVLGMLAQHHWLHWSILSQQVLFLAFIASAGVLVLYAVRCTQADWRIDMSLASLTPLIFSPLIEEMHMIFALPTLLVFARRGYDYFQLPDCHRRARSAVLALVTLASCTILSLPVTFGLNAIVFHYPQLFWLQTQMFCVVITLFCTIMWQVVQPCPTDASRR